MKIPIRIAVTGAAGNIGCSLLFRIISGEMFGLDQPIILHLIEVESSVKKLEGIVMELEDCSSHLLRRVIITTDLKEGFLNINWAILVGSIPRTANMKRKDLLGHNSKIFEKQCKALEKYASEDIRILTVGNPCNTNCYIAMKNALEIRLCNI